MKQNEVYAYIYDFISQLMENQDLFSIIKKIVLFGSIARGDFNKQSDVDLFIDIKDMSKEKLTYKLTQKELNKFQLKIRKTWVLRKIELPIKIIVGSFEQDRWKELKEDIIGYSKILYGGFEESPSNLQYSFFITYDTSKILQAEKMAFLRACYGYTSIKNKKRYTCIGLLEKLGGKKISPQTILISKEVLYEIKSLLKKYQIPYTIKEIWIK